MFDVNRDRTSSRWPAALLTMLLLVGTACGGRSGEGPPAAGGDGQAEDPSAAVERAMIDYLAALADEDYARACGHLSAEAIEQLADLMASGDGCEETLATSLDLSDDQRETLRSAQVSSVDIVGRTATVHLEGGRTAPMILAEEGWLIAEFRL